MSLWTVGRIATLALALFVAPLAAAAQPVGKVWRIGFLHTSSPSLTEPNVEAFRHRLRELGYVEGQNIVSEYRWAHG